MAVFGFPDSQPRKAEIFFLSIMYLDIYAERVVSCNYNPISQQSKQTLHISW